MWSQNDIAGALVIGGLIVVAAIVILHGIPKP